MAVSKDRAFTQALRKMRATALNQSGRAASDFAILSHRAPMRTAQSSSRSLTIKYKSCCKLVHWAQRLKSAFAERSSLKHTDKSTLCGRGLQNSYSRLASNDVSHWRVFLVECGGRRFISITTALELQPPLNCIAVYLSRGKVCTTLPEGSSMFA